ncbi:MAG: hypothetical protein ACKOVA_01915 [Novosphingobium sp.]
MDTIDVNLSRIREALRLYENAHGPDLEPSINTSTAPAQPAPISEMQTPIEPVFLSDPSSAFSEVVEASVTADLETGSVSDPVGLSLPNVDGPMREESPMSSDTIEPREEGLPEDNAVAPCRDLVVIKQSMWSRFKSFIGLK